MMKRKPNNLTITINELYHFAPIHVASIILVIVFGSFLLIDLKDLRNGVSLWPEVIVELLFLVAIINMNIKLIATWRIVKVYTNRIESYSLLEKTKDVVDTTGDVYYYYEEEQLLLDKEKYLVVFCVNTQKNETQQIEIKMLYKKSVQDILPREEWIEYLREEPKQ